MQFTQGLHRAVQQQSNAIATSCEGRRRTFTELRDRVARFASGLQQLGCNQSSRIAILGLNSDYYLEAYLAIAWLHAASVPLNYRWSAAELRYAIDDAGCDILLVDAHFAEMGAALFHPASSIRHTILLGVAQATAGWVAGEKLITDSKPIDDAQACDDALLGIFYTGGTTGVPKGVMLSHRNLCSSALSMLAEGMFQEGGVGLHVAPMFHLADMLMVTSLLLRGCRHVVLPAFDPATMLRLIADEGVTDTLLVPTMLQALVESPALVGAETSSLRHILYGASPASETLIERALAAFPDTKLLQGYGMTESAAFISALPPAAHLPGPARKLRSAGRATFDTQVRIVTSEGVEAKRGTIGEITTRGPNVMMGYLNKADATTATLKHGWLHSGDMGYMDEEGFIFIVDRLKDMIITGGENVYSVEVENALASHPSVAAAAVIGIPCDQMGEKVHAAIVLHPGASIDLESVRAHSRNLIAGYKCPRSIEVVAQFPVSGAGKILKTELRKAYWDKADRLVS